MDIIGDLSRALVGARRWTLFPELQNLGAISLARLNPSQIILSYRETSFMEALHYQIRQLPFTVFMYERQRADDR